MDPLLLLATAAVCFGAGLAVGRAARPSPPTPAVPPDDAPAPFPPSEVARALTLHDALGDFDPEAPSQSDLQRDVGRFGARRYADGEASALDLIRFDLARVGRALDLGDPSAATTALDRLHGRVEEELGRTLTDVDGVPSWVLKGGPGR